MTATTINSFPSLHSLSSPRSWAMAIIVLLHLGFFWALTNGLSHSIGQMFEPEPPQYLPLPEKPTPPPPRKIDFEVQPKPVKVTYVPPVIDIQTDDSTDGPLVEPTPPPPTTFTDTGDVSPPQPVVVEPRIDPRRGLSEPAYPSSEIRLEHEGTVLLSVYILANGRVGDVKLEKSSGYPKLDESALREARVWRFQPGSRDGTPVAMWKQLPISFRITK
jgi:protein TonB